MSKLTALALSIAVLRGVSAFLALSPLAGMSFCAVMAGISLSLVSSGILAGLGAPVIIGAVFGMLSGKLTGMLGK